MAKTKKTTKEDLYEIVLSLNGKEYKSSGNTFENALNKIKVEKFATKGVLNISKLDKKAQILLNIIQMRKLFGIVGSTTQQIIVGFFSNRVEQLLK